VYGFPSKSSNDMTKFKCFNHIIMDKTVLTESVRKEVIYVQCTAFTSHDSDLVADHGNSSAYSTG